MRTSRMQNVEAGVGMVGLPYYQIQTYTLSDSTTKTQKVIFCKLIVLQKVKDQTLLFMTLYFINNDTWYINREWKRYCFSITLAKKQKWIHMALKGAFGKI